MNPSSIAPYKNDFTRMFNCSFPIIAGPMFLVSDETLVSAVSNAGGIGGMPSLNWRTTEKFSAAVKNLKTMTQGPFGINLIVNQSNSRQHPDLEVCVSEKVPLVITSLGNPKNVIEKMHAVGCRVFCDVTTLEHAQKVQSLGADGVIAVSSGAGGHAGPTAMQVLIPYLKKHLSIPVIAAGGIATGQQMAAALLLGASGVQVGTRFIASREAKVAESYQQAILKATPEDILLTLKVSGTPCAVIRTPYIEKIGLGLNPIEAFLHKNKTTKKTMKLIRSLLGARALEKAVAMPTWKEVWSAGQGVGLIDELMTCQEIVNQMAKEARETLQNAPNLA